jgi:hypothetical protein
VITCESYCFSFTKIKKSKLSSSNFFSWYIIYCFPLTTAMNSTWTDVVTERRLLS